MPAKRRTRPRFWTYLVPLGLFVIGAIIALLVTRGYVVDVDSLQLQKRGVVVLHSTPDSADIRIDNRPSDKQTDARFKLAPGTYRFSVSQPKRHPWQQDIRLGPGNAVIEEIILFPLAPERTELTTTPVTKVAASPNHEQLVAITQAGRLVRVDPAGSSQTIRTLPASVRQPRSVAVSNDGAVALSNRSRTVVYSPTGRQVGNFAGTAAQFAGNRVVFVRQGKVLISSPSGSGAQTVVTRPRSWAVASGRIYFVSRSGKLGQASSAGPAETVSAVEGVGAVTSITALGSEAALAIQRNGDFGLVESGRYQPVGSDVVRARLSRDGATVAYRTSRELRVWIRQNSENHLVTSLTKPPSVVQALPGGHYLVFRSGSTLQAMARDGSNQTTVARRIGQEPIILGLDSLITTDSRTGRLIRINLED